MVNKIKLARSGQQISLKEANRNSHVVVCVDNIIAIDRLGASDRLMVYYVNVEGNNMMLDTKMDIEALNEILPNQFIKVCKNVIINTRFVDRYSKKEVTVKYGMFVHSFPCDVGLLLNQIVELD